MFRIEGRFSIKKNRKVFFSKFTTWFKNTCSITIAGNRGIRSRPSRSKIICFRRRPVRDFLVDDGRAMMRESGYWLRVFGSRLTRSAGSITGNQVYVSWYAYFQTVTYDLDAMQPSSLPLASLPLPSRVFTLRFTAQLAPSSTRISSTFSSPPPFFFSPPARFKAAIQTRSRPKRRIFLIAW